MGCIKSRSKIWGESVGGLVILISLVLLPTSSWAAFASQFSLGVGEEYNDNIFFSKKKDHDDSEVTRIMTYSDCHMLTLMCVCSYLYAQWTFSEAFKLDCLKTRNIKRNLPAKRNWPSHL